MADTENNAASSKLGFLPKLMLWSLVLLFGYLYLGAVERHGGSVGTAPVDMADGEASVVSKAVRPLPCLLRRATSSNPGLAAAPSASAPSVAATSAPAAPAPAAPAPVRAPVAAPAPASVSAPVSAKAPAAPSVPAAAPGPIVGAPSKEPETSGEQGGGASIRASRDAQFGAEPGGIRVRPDAVNSPAGNAANDTAGPGRAILQRCRADFADADGRHSSAADAHRCRRPRWCPRWHLRLQPPAAAAPSANEQPGGYRCPARDERL